MAISTIDQTGLNAPLTLTSPVLTTPNLGTPSAVNLSNATALPKSAMPSGTVIQTVAFGNNTQYSGTSGAETYLFSASITPTYSNSKILINYSVASGVSSNSPNFAIQLLLRRGTTTAGTLIAYQRFGRYEAATVTREMFACNSLCGLDSPATTSSVSYGVFVSNVDGNFTYSINNNGNTSMILQEIVG